MFSSATQPPPYCQKCHRKWVSDIQNGRRQPFCKQIHKNKQLWYWSEMVRSDFWTSKMATGSHFVKNIYQKSWASDLNNVRTDCWPTTTWYKFTFGQYIYRQVCWEQGNIHCVRPLIGRMHTIVVTYVRICTKGVSCFPHNTSEESAKSLYTYQRERDYNFNYFVHIIMIITKLSWNKL